LTAAQQARSYNPNINNVSLADWTNTIFKEIKSVVRNVPSKKVLTDATMIPLKYNKVTGDPIYQALKSSIVIICHKIVNTKKS
jgi:hypothetical protein